jgi:hypothetical protein
MMAIVTPVIPQIEGSDAERIYPVGAFGFRTVSVISRVSGMAL